MLYALIAGIEQEAFMTEEFKESEIFLATANQLLGISPKEDLTVRAAEDLQKNLRYSENIDN